MCNTKSVLVSQNYHVFYRVRAGHLQKCKIAVLATLTWSWTTSEPLYLCECFEGATDAWGAISLLTDNVSAQIDALDLTHQTQLAERIMETISTKRQLFIDWTLATLGLSNQDEFITFKSESEAAAVVSLQAAESFKKRQSKLTKDLKAANTKHEEDMKTLKAEMKALTLLGAKSSTKARKQSRATTRFSSDDSDGDDDDKGSEDDSWGGEVRFRPSRA